MKGSSKNESTPFRYTSEKGIKDVVNRVTIRESFVFLLRTTYLWSWDVNSEVLEIIKKEENRLRLPLMTISIRLEQMISYKKKIHVTRLCSLQSWGLGSQSQSFKRCKRDEINMNLLSRSKFLLRLKRETNFIFYLIKKKKLEYSSKVYIVHFGASML